MVLRRFSLAAILVLMSASLFAQVSEEAKRIHSHVLGVDSHNDTLQRVLIEGVDIGQRLTDGSVDLPRLRAGVGSRRSRRAGVCQGPCPQR